MAKKKFLIAVEEELLDKLREKARESGESVSGLFIRAVKEMLRSQSTGKKVDYLIRNVHTILDKLEIAVPNCFGNYEGSGACAVCRVRGRCKEETEKLHGRWGAL